jgi:hypothetical protein
MECSMDRPPRPFMATCIALGLVGAAFALTSLAAAGEALAQDPPPKLTVVGEGPVPVKATADDDAANLALILVNEGPASVRVEDVAFEASSWTPPGARSPVVRTAGVRVETFGPLKTLPPGATRLVVRLNGLAQLTGDPVDGQLILRGENGRVLGAQSVSITPAPQPSADWPNLFFWLGVGMLALLAVVAFATLAVARPAGVSLGDALTASAPGPDWTVDGWSGKLALVGGLLAIVLGEITLPTVPREINKETLVQMNVVFVVMLAVGPFVFYALRRRKVRASWGTAVRLLDMDTKGVWGLKAVLLGSYVVTAVAVTGQIGALILLGCEITSNSWHVLVIVIGALLALLALRSFWVVTYGQARADWDAKAKAREPLTEQPVKVTHQPIRVSVSEPPASS